MQYPTRVCIALMLLCPLIAGAEGKMPRLYEYDQDFWKEELISRPDIVELDTFTVSGKKNNISPWLERAIEKELRDSRNIQRSRISLDTDDEDILALPEGARIVPVQGRGGFDLRVMDVFFIDLPGGGVLKAHFKSGVSMQISKNGKVVLRPSRKKLISFRWDW